MAKETVEQLIDGGKATPGPPIGPAIGPLGLDINEVINAINEKTKNFEGMKIPIKVIIDTETKKYEIELGSPTTSALIKKEIGIEKISYGDDSKTYNITTEQVKKIADMKKTGILASDEKGAILEILGTLVSMQKINVENISPKVFLQKFKSGEIDLNYSANNGGENKIVEEKEEDENQKIISIKEEENEQQHEKRTSLGETGGSSFGKGETREEDKTKGSAKEKKV